MKPSTREEMVEWEKHYETAEPPQWSHIHEGKKEKKMPRVIWWLVFFAAAYLVIVIVGPVLK